MINPDRAINITKFKTKAGEKNIINPKESSRLYNIADDIVKRMMLMPITIKIFLYINRILIIIFPKDMVI